ncbi:MAG: YfhO family protein [Acidobacteriota bacterium]
MVAGASPFWLDGFYMGHPLAFTQEAPVLYPLTVPLLLTGAPVHRLADVFSLAHLWLAGLGGFLLVRFLTNTRIAPLFGGLAYMLSARTLQSVMWPNAIAVAALIPFVLLGIGWLAAGRRRAGLVLTSLSAGLALLAARPHSLLGASPAFVAFAAAQLWAAADRRRFLLDLGLAAALAALLGAPSLLPTALVFPETSRFGGLAADARNVGALSIAELDQVFLPVDGLARWPEAASYPGAVTALFFLAGIVFCFRRTPAFPCAVFLALSAAAVAGFVFAFGDSGPYRFVSSWPLLRGFRTPVRFLACSGLALAFGSALALSAFESSMRRGRALAVGATLLLAVDLGAHTVRAAGTVPEETYRARPALAGYLAGIPPDPLGFPRRFWSFGYFPPLHLLSDSERPAAAGADALAFAAGARFGLEAVQGAGPPLARTQEALESRSIRIAQLAGASRTVLRGPRDADGDTEAPLLEGAQVVRMPGSFPRALLVHEAVVVPSKRALGALLDPSFDPARAAILEEGSAWSTPGATSAADAVTLVERRPSHVTFSTRAASGALLVFFDAYAEGWTATVDGVTEPVLRTDVCFRGVRVPGGTHRVVFSYRPPGLRDGLLLGLLGLVLLAAAARRGDAMESISIQARG